MSNDERAVIIGELDKRMKANQPGLLSLFNAAGIPASDVIKLRDLNVLRKVSYEGFAEAMQLLYPGSTVSANGLLYVPGSLGDEYISTADILDSTGVNYNYNYTTDLDNYEGVQEQLVSYKTLLTWLLIALAVAIVIYLLYYFYKRMK